MKSPWTSLIAQFKVPQLICENAKNTWMLMALTTSGHNRS